LAGVHPSILPNLPDGTFDVDLLVSRIRGDDPHEPRFFYLTQEISTVDFSAKNISKFPDLS